MLTPFSGGCACRAIRYECRGEALFSLNCHCRDCQRETGSAFAPILGVSANAFTMTKGEPKFFDLKGGSGQTTRRAFCGECGSPLFGLPSVRPDLVTIRAGSLDDPSWFRPSQDIFTASAQPWDAMNPDLPKTPKA